MDNKQGFKILAKNTNHNTQKDLQEDGSLIITGLASTTNKDLQHDIIEPTAIESMKTQAVGLNLCMDHNIYKTDEIIGAIIEVGESSENELWIKARIRPKFAGEVKEMLDTGINLGFSISGDVTDYSESESDLGWTIRDITLYEISLTGMPANWDTFGTVSTSKGLVESTCVTGACYEILKHKNENDELVMKVDKNIVKEEVPVTDEAKETITRQEAVDLFNQLSAENNEQIKADIIEELKPEIEKIVEEKLGQQEAQPDDEAEEKVDEDEVESEESKESEDKESESEVEAEDDESEPSVNEEEPKEEEDEEEDKKSKAEEEEDDKESEAEDKEEEPEEDEEKPKEASLNDVMDAIKTLITEIQTNKSTNDESQKTVDSEEDNEVVEKNTNESDNTDNDNEPVEKDMTETVVENATEQLLNTLIKNREVAPTKIPTEKDIKDHKESESEEGTLSFTKSLLDKI